MVSRRIIKILGEDLVEHIDAIAVEEPLEISISVLNCLLYTSDAADE